jgi:outer membrane protein assembly factor BamE
MNTVFDRVFRGLPALLPAALLPLLLASCKSVEMPKVPGITPYRMVIQQGNFISQEMVSQLKPGMTREQVRFVLGTPLVTDIFHADRWDYVYYRELANGKRDQRNLSVVFEKDRLARVIGDLMPAEGAVPAASGFDPQIKPDAKPAAKPAAEAPREAPRPAAESAPAAKEEEKKAEEPKERGFFGRMLEKIGL